MDLILIREMDDHDNEWLVVTEPYVGMEREITRFKWTEDLRANLLASPPPVILAPSCAYADIDLAETAVAAIRKTAIILQV